jgi:hypothetical protein
MANKTTTEKATEEGARSLSVLLSSLDDGQFHEDASEDLHTLCAAMARLSENHDKISGTFTIKLTMKCRRNGTMHVTPEITVKTPKAPRTEQILWLTKGNNLSLENPRQQKLPLREVPRTPNEAPISPDTEAHPIKSV